MAETLLENEGVRVRRMESCFLCGPEGTVLYAGLRDRLFDAPGVWNLRRCGHCGLVWLDPKPIPEDVFMLYRTYFADLGEGVHDERQRRGGRVIRSIQAACFGRKILLPGPLWLPIGVLAGMIPMLRDYAAVSMMFLQKDKPGKLLDVGCGMGDFLLAMRDSGWDVQGLEPYAKAAKAARERGIPVLGETVENADLAPSSMDVITSCHVIEHVDDPRLFFRKSLDALRPGGKLVVLTPNADSLGHCVFKAAWIHLDAPRHLNLFTVQGLRNVASSAGFEVLSARTITRGSIFAYLYSKQVQNGLRGWTTLSKDGRFTRLELLRARSFWVREEAKRMVFPRVGEELLLVARKPIPGLDPKNEQL